VASLGKVLSFVGRSAVDGANYSSVSRNVVLPNTRQSIVVEIGGRRKGHKQFKGISEKKRLILTQSDRIDKMRKPLVLAGFL
jgi:hypothetical protein